MSETPLFSILIANYNNGKYFKDCFESILKQTYSHFEVVIVDDCSTDDSAEIIQELIKNDARFLFFQNEKNQQTGFTKSKCASLAKGELCAFLDPDDALAENALDIMVKKHQENPDVSLVYSDSYYCDTELNITREYRLKQVENKNPHFFNQAEIFHLAAYKNACYKQTSGIDPFLKRAVDQDLYLKLYDVGNVLHTPELLYYYRIHDSGISTKKNVKNAYFWHWVVILDTAKRRNLNLEKEFWEEFILKKDFERYENQKWIQLGKKIGLL